MSKYDIPLHIAQQWHKQRFGKQCITEGKATKSPCPGCGGTDRFKIWPKPNDPNLAAFHCFQCNLENGLLEDIRDEIRGGKPTEMNVARVQKGWKPYKYQWPIYDDGERIPINEMTLQEIQEWKKAHARHLDEEWRDALNAL